MNKIRITIGFPTRDDYHGLWPSIHSLRMYQPEVMRQVEIVVVDNNPYSDAAGSVEFRREMDSRTHSQTIQGSNHWLQGRTIEATRDGEQGICNLGGYQYVPLADPQCPTAAKNKVFEVARGEVVLCLDSHVMLPARSIARTLEWFGANPDFMGLIHGPMMYDGLVSWSTHLGDRWRGEMHGTWESAWLCARCDHLFAPRDGANDTLTYHELKVGAPAITSCPRCHSPYPRLRFSGHERPLKEAGHRLTAEHPGIGAFEIPACGMGLFGCRKDAWLPFSDLLRGFGGEEYTTQDRYRHRGRTHPGEDRRVLCLPWLHWLHRYGRPEGPPYVPIKWHKMRNYVIEHARIGADLEPIRRHFIDELRVHPHEWDALMTNPASPPPWPSTEPATKVWRNQSTGEIRATDPSGRSVTIPPDAAQGMVTAQAPPGMRWCPQHGWQPEAHFGPQTAAISSTDSTTPVSGPAVVFSPGHPFHMPPLAPASTLDELVNRITEAVVERVNTSLEEKVTRAVSSIRAVPDTAQPDVKISTGGEVVQAYEAARGSAELAPAPAPPGKKGAAPVKFDSFDDWLKHIKSAEHELRGHEDALIELASRCAHVTELGGRRGVSTVCLAMGKPRTLRVIGPDPGIELQNIAQLAAGQPIVDYQQAVTEEADGEPTDLLFIDSIPHNAPKLRAELERHAPHVSRYIVLHDTVIFGERGEGENKPGLVYALKELLGSSANLTSKAPWFIASHASHSHGLTVLSRDPDDLPPARVHLWAPGAGVGTELKDILAGMGINPSASCTCNAMAAEMDVKGTQWVKDNREDIVKRIKENQAKWGWKEALGNMARALSSGNLIWRALTFRLNPVDPISSLLDQAIERAEAKHAAEGDDAAKGGRKS